MLKDLKIATTAFDKIGIGGISEEEFHFVGCPPELANLINYRAARQSDFEAQRKLEEMQRRTDESLARRVRRQDEIEQKRLKNEAEKMERQRIIDKKLKEHNEKIREEQEER